MTDDILKDWEKRHDQIVDTTFREMQNARDRALAGLGIGGGNITLHLTPEQALQAKTALRRMSFDHVLSLTDGAAGGLDATGGNVEQAYAMQTALSIILDALTET